MLGVARRLVLLVLAAIVVQRPGRADGLGAGADATIAVHPGQIVRPVPPGVVGWGAMWKRAFLLPPPPADFSDESHAAYIRQVGEELAP